MSSSVYYVTLRFPLTFKSACFGLTSSTGLPLELEVTSQAGEPAIFEKMKVTQQKIL